jgi:hypothetical protein
VLLVDFYVVMKTTGLHGSSFVLLVDCNLVIENMIEDGAIVGMVVVHEATR